LRVVLLGFHAIVARGLEVMICVVGGPTQPVRVAPGGCGRRRGCSSMRAAARSGQQPAEQGAFALHHLGPELPGPEPEPHESPKGRIAQRRSEFAGSEAVDDPHEQAREARDQPQQEPDAEIEGQDAAKQPPTYHRSLTSRFAARRTRSLRPKPICLPYRTVGILH